MARFEMFDRESGRVDKPGNLNQELLFRDLVEGRKRLYFNDREGDGLIKVSFSPGQKRAFNYCGPRLKELRETVPASYERTLTDLVIPIIQQMAVNRATFRLKGRSNSHSFGRADYIFRETVYPFSEQMNRIRTPHFLRFDPSKNMSYYSYIFHKMEYFSIDYSRIYLPHASNASLDQNAENENLSLDSIPPSHTPKAQDELFEDISNRDFAQSVRKKISNAKIFGRGKVRRGLMGERYVVMLDLYFSGGRTLSQIGALMGFSECMTFQHGERILDVLKHSELCKKADMPAITKRNVFGRGLK